MSLPPTMCMPAGMQVKTSPLFLQVANPEGMAWVNTMLTQHHYLHQGVSPRSMPMAYLVLQQWEKHMQPVGCLLFNHTQCSYVKQWFGTLQHVRAGDAYLTQWELVNLARVWVSNEIQQPESPYSVSNAASRVISAALKEVVRDFLLIHPPVFFDEPWQLRECLTYLHANLFKGTIYRASNFVFRRDNGKGLVTYSRPLRDLHAHEVDLVREASRLHAKNRQRRASKRYLEEVSWSPLFRLYPVPQEGEWENSRAA